MSMKLQRRPRFSTKYILITALLLGAMVAQPFQGMVNALQTLNYQEVPFTSDELVNWSRDRTTPSGDFGAVSSYASRSDVLRMSVDTAQQSTMGAFYHTEGLQRQLGNDVDSVKVDLYVDSDWQSTQMRAGLWGVTKDSSGGIQTYPILEFTTAEEAGHIGWRVWDGVTGWTNLTSTVAWDSWSTLALTLNESTDKVDMFLNGMLVASNSYSADHTTIGSVILNMKNYGPTTAGYDTYWSNFGYGEFSFVAEAPIDLSFTSPAVCGGSTNQFNTVASWSPVVDAASYSYKAWKEGHPTYSSLATAYTVNGITGTSRSGQFNLGEGKYYFAVQTAYADGEKSDWSTSCEATYDTTAPTIGAVFPANGSTTNGSKRFTVQVSDTSGTKKVAMYIRTDSGFNKEYALQNNGSDNVWYADVNTKMWAGDGEYNLVLRAVDNANNVKYYNNRQDSHSFFIDNTAPVISNIQVDNPAFGVTKIRATITDQNGVNLSPSRTHVRFTHGSGNDPLLSQSANAAFTHVEGDEYETTIDTTAFVPEGYTDTYWLYFRLQDTLGNAVGNDDVRGVVVDNRVPVLSAEDFGVGSWTVPTDGFTGVNVGFNIRDFKTVSGITVELYNQNGSFVTNTATLAFLDSINTLGWSQLSSPFVVSGTLNDTWCASGPCWDMGSHTWTSVDKPVKAVITVEGTDVGDRTVTKMVENNTFSEAAGSFESLLPIVTPASPSRPAVQPILPQNASQRAVAALRSNPSVVQTQDTEDTQVLGDSTETPVAVQTGGVLAANDDSYDESAATVDEEQGSSNYSWVWFVAAPLAIGGLWWMAVALRRSDS